RWETGAGESDREAAWSEPPPKAGIKTYSTPVATLSRQPMRMKAFERKERAGPPSSVETLNRTLCHALQPQQIHLRAPHAGPGQAIDAVEVDPDRKPGNGSLGMDQEEDGFPVASGDPIAMSAGPTEKVRRMTAALILRQASPCRGVPEDGFSNKIHALQDLAI